MTTFSAILLDRFLEPKPTSSYSNNTNKKIPDVIPPYPKLEASYNLKSSSRRQEIPPPYPQLHRRNSTSSPSERVHIHPELYTTPEPTPLPDSPTSSFPPSPYVINHKRRGPRLLKSLWDQNVATTVAEIGDEKLKDEVLVNEIEVDEIGIDATGDCLERENGENEHFFDPQESLSFSSTVDIEDYGGERWVKADTPDTPVGEFYDAWEGMLFCF